MVKNTKIIAMSLVIAVLFSSCATVFSKSKYPVTIISEPSGANVKVKNLSGQVIYQAKTPTSVTLKSSDIFFGFGAEYSVILEKEGYETQIKPITSSISGAYIFNFLFFPGFLIDALTGCMYNIDQTLKANLDKK